MQVSTIQRIGTPVPRPAAVTGTYNGFSEPGVVGLVADGVHVRVAGATYVPYSPGESLAVHSNGKGAKPSMP
jgi:hypothetical protein